MRDILRTNDPVLLSFVESLFREAEIDFLVADQHISIIEGSIGAFPRRVLVHDDDLHEARRIIVDAGLGAELLPQRPVDAKPAPDGSDPDPDPDAEPSPEGGR